MSALAGQVAIVTGGSRGIGRAISERLAREGASVMIAYFFGDGPAEAEETIQAITSRGGNAAAMPVDLSREADVEGVFREAAAQFGPVHILVNNAGCGAAGLIADASEADFDRIFGLNVKSILFSLKQASHRLEDGGRIVNISSVTVREPAVGLGLYAASKAAVRTLTEVAAMELGSRGIRVNSVLPGLVATRMTQDVPAQVWDQTLARTTLGRHGQPDDIAGVVAFLVGDDAGWITGQHILANGGTMG